MDLKLKLLKLPDAGDYLIVVVRGIIDAESFGRIFHQIADATRSFRNCRILIDLEAAELNLDLSNTRGFDKIAPDLLRDDFKIAIVFSPRTGEFERLRVLSDSLCGLGLRVALFDCAKGAVNWLGNGT